MKTLKALSIAVVVAATAYLPVKGDMPDVSTGRWQPAGSLAAERRGAAAVLLPSGPVLVIGGSASDGAALDSVELFGASGTFSPVAPMASPRADHSAVLLYDGRVLVTGGRNSDGALGGAEIYSEGVWSAAGALSEARWGHTSTLLNDGRVLVAGGENAAGALSSVEVFDPETNSFTSGGALTSSRRAHAAAPLRDGRVLLAGGFDGSSFLSSIDVFDPATGATTPLPVSLNVARAGLSATTLLDGRVLFFGGNDGTNNLGSAEIYDPATGTIALAGSTTTARREHFALLLPNNNGVLLAGGVTPDGIAASAELYMPWTGTFAPTGSMGAARYEAAALALADDGLLMVAGGEGQASSEIYRFATIATDAGDYYPGQTVYLTGSGWQPGETVTLGLRELPEEHDSRTFTATADPFGRLDAPLFVVEDHHVGVRFYLTARGAASEAQITFTDAVNTATAPQFFTVNAGLCTSTGTGPSNVNVAICAQSLLTTNNGNANNNFVEFRWFRQGATTPDFIERFPSGTQVLGQNLSGIVATSIQTPTVPGTWTVKVCQASSGCSNTPTTLSSATIQITAPNRTLTVTGSGAGSGTVTSNPAGVSCSIANGVTTGSCSASFNDNAIVVLTATESSGSTFNDWSGDGAGTTTRTVTMSANRTVDAHFNGNQTITFAPLPGKTYGNAPFTLTATGGGSPNPVTFALAAGSAGCLLSGTNNSTVTITAANATGQSCSITASQAGNANYNAAPDVTQSFTIARATATIGVQGFTGAYDGDPHGATGTATGVNGENLASLLEFGTTFINVPGGTAHWSFNATNTNTNYNSTSGDAAIVINPANATISVQGHSGVYDGDPHGASGTATGVKGENLATLFNFGDSFTNVPGGTAHWTFNATSTNPNYNPASGDATITLTPADATISVQGHSGVYDGDPHGAGGTATGVKGEDLATLFNLGDSFTNVPGGTAHWTFNAPGAGHNGNYNDAAGDATITLTAADATISVQGFSGTYDGDPHHATGTATGVKGENLAELFNFGDSFTNVPGGTAHWTFNATSANVNYNPASGNVAITLTQRPLVAEFTINDRVYNGGTDAMIHDVLFTSGYISEDDVHVHITGAVATFMNKNVGNGKTVNISSVSLEGADAGNYSIPTTATATASITRRTLVVGVTGIPKVYDGTTGATVTFSDDRVAGDDVTVTGNASFGDKNVGTNKAVTVTGITLTGADAGNYYANHTASTTASITPRGLAVSATGVNKTYDGNTQATVTLSDDRLTGDVLTLSYSSAAFGTKNAGAGKTVTVSGINVSGADAGNYTFNTSTTTTASIDPRPITVKADDKSKPFGAGDPPLTYQLTYGSLVSGEGFSGALKRDSGEAVGSYAIKRDTLQAGDNGGANYAMTFVEGVLTIGKWYLKGYYQPVGEPNSIVTAPGAPAPMVNTGTAWNLIRGGNTVPLKFNVFDAVGGTEQQTVAAAFGTTPGFAAYQLLACSGGSIDDEVALNDLSTGGTELRYDGTQFIQNWKTPKVTGADVCYRAVVTTRDGSTITAFFKVRK
jgi:YDG domain-containing protein/MBG domain-containing protein/galactose oxidase-like protein/List-Bact-rpt repeat protein/Kelch motif protein